MIIDTYLLFYHYRINLIKKLFLTDYQIILIRILSHYFSSNYHAMYDKKPTIKKKKNKSK